MTTTDPDDIRDPRAVLADRIALLAKNHPYACSGCALEDAQKKLDTLDQARNTAIARLTTEHNVPDSTAATHIVDTLATWGFTLDQLPSTAHGSAIGSVFRELTIPERISLGDIIAGGPEVIWPSWLHSAFEALEAEAGIAQGRAVLKDKLDAAVKAVAEAFDSYNRLAGPLYDVDYAEGSDLLERYLDEADRAIRTAVAINPHHYH